MRSPRTPATDRDFVVILDAVRHIVRALRESSRAAELRHGVSGAQLFVLRALAQGPALSMNELAERTHTHQSSVSVVARRLEARALIQRVAARSDSRRVEIALTAKGRRLAARAPEAAQERLVGGLRRLAPARRRELARSLAALLDSMGLASRRPPMFFEDERRAPAARGRRRA